jgi:hypothetical protein
VPPPANRPQITGLCERAMTNHPPAARARH